MHSQYSRRRIGWTVDKDFFKTTDLYFAAFLQVCDKALLRIERDPTTHQCAFVFRNEDIEELKEGWLNDTRFVPPQQYAQRLKSLKAGIHL